MVFQNIFLDGNTTKDSHHVSKERFVADFKLGVAFQVGAVEVSYTQVVRTPEFRGNNDPQVFGSVTVGLTF